MVCVCGVVCTYPGFTPASLPAFFPATYTLCHHLRWGLGFLAPATNSHLLLSSHCLRGRERERHISTHDRLMDNTYTQTFPPPGCCSFLVLGSAGVLCEDYLIQDPGREQVGKVCLHIQAHSLLRSIDSAGKIFCYLAKCKPLPTQASQPPFAPLDG